jgi:phenylacetate-CoA ligase
MIRTPLEERRRLQTLPRAELEQRQVARLNRLLEAILPHNRFYAERLAGVRRPLHALADLAALPFTHKQDLHGGRGGQAAASLTANLTWPLERYVRFHRTSGTSGRPLGVLDTAEDWQWWIDTWQSIYDAAGIEPGDRLLLAFSFGPFIGFWSAFDAAVARGCLAVPGGGLSSVARLDLIRSVEATAVLCTPTYALHLAEVAREHKIALAGLGVKRLIVAGEPGGTVPATRARIESAWGAAVLDHAGASEVGPWGFGDPAGRGLHVLESEFIAEFISVGTGRPAADGELAELVLTNLGRVGCPTIRYRTGDLVRPLRDHDGACRFVLLEGGVLGRADDMLVVRGVNVFPSAIEQIVHGFPEIVEYRVTATRAAELDALRVEIEDRLERPQRVADELRLRLGLKVEVACVPLGSLPRGDGKGRHFVDLRR